MGASPWEGSSDQSTGQILLRKGQLGASISQHSPSWQRVPRPGDRIRGECHLHPLQCMCKGVLGVGRSLLLSPDKFLVGMVPVKARLEEW